MLCILAIKGPTGEWHDYSPWILADEYSVDDEDVDSDETGRVLNNADMRRDKRAEKWNANIALLDLPHAVCKQVFIDLRQTFFDARVLTPLDVVESKFYCSGRPASLGMVIDEDNITWSKVSFNLHQK